MHKIAHFQYVNIHFAKFESKGMKAIGVTTRHPKSVADEQTNGGTGRWTDGVDPLPDLLSPKRCRKKKKALPSCSYMQAP